MKKINNIKYLFTIIVLLIFYNCKAQQTISEPLNEDEQLFVGTWVVEGSTLENRWVFTENRLLEDYYNNTIYETYSWSIVNSINSGVKSQYLEIVNINDATDYYNYEISILNDERLTIIYQRKNNMGLAKPATYFRQ